MRIRSSGALAVVVEHPAEVAGIRIARVVIEIDGTAQINPAHDGKAILIGERCDLDPASVRSFVIASDGVWRRHGCALVIDVVAGAIPVSGHAFALVDVIT